MHTSLLMLATWLAYFLLLLILSRRSARGGAQGNDAFFRAGRSSHWALVAFGMIGASISGVTFISVPGWAKSTGLTYLQMCMGFIVGYAAVALVLLPLYYRLRLTSIYSWLGQRFGPRTHRTGALFFVLSKLTGAAARLYIVCLVINRFLTLPLLAPWGLEAAAFPLTVGLSLLFIWLYTRRAGMQTLVRTDALQTACMLLAAGCMLVAAAQQMHLTAGGVVQMVSQSDMCRLFEWDAASPQAFWRQFLSGVFIVIVMTGLDQDMMQKNLTCRSLRDAQKDMCTYGLAFLPVNALFLGLGIVLYALCTARGLPSPAAGDELMPMLVQSGALGTWVVLPFTLGLVAAAFSSADSALTALTTTVCIDLLGMERSGTEQAADRRTRRRVHLLLTLAFALCIVAYKAVGSGSVINAIYVMASYTYGPLLGLYAYGLFTRRPINDRLAPIVCLAAPLLCALLDYGAPLWWNYRFGYELLMLNGLLTMLGLWATGKR